MPVAGFHQLESTALVSREVIDDPYTVYHLLRYEDPVHWSELLQAWVLTRYVDVDRVLRDPRFSSAHRRVTVTARLPPDTRDRMHPIDAVLGRWMLNLDGDEHLGNRSRLNRFFTPSAVERLRPRIEQVAAELLTAIDPAGVELVGEFCYPLPVRVIAWLVGVPLADHARLVAWFETMSTYFELGPARARPMEDMRRTLDEMGDYLDRLMTSPHAGRAPIVAELLGAEERGEMTRPELLATLVLLLFSGHESTRSMIGNSVLALLQNPDQRAWLIAEPGLMPSAVEEFLRYDGPFMRQDRTAVADVEVGGRRIATGDHVIVVLGAANRDPFRFPAPDRLILSRTDNAHLAFGASRHYCLGAALARCEVAVAVSTIFQTLPKLCLADRPLIWRDHFNHRGLRELHLRG